jgi:hypothetical protein
MLVMVIAVAGLAFGQQRRKIPCSANLLSSSVRKRSSSASYAEVRAARGQDLSDGGRDRHIDHHRYRRIRLQSALNVI